MIACKCAGRAARLMELDPKYVDVMVTRWQEFTGKTATLEGEGSSFADVEARPLAQASPETPRRGIGISAAGGAIVGR